MDIYEYIQDNYNLHLNPQYTKHEEFFHHFQREMERKYGIKTIEIYSTSMFPRQVSIGNERYYLSDNHFWNMYEHYLTAHFLCSRRISIGISYDNLMSMISNMLLLAMANLQDHHPHLALSFAQEYQRCGMRMGDYAKSFFDTGVIPEIDRIVFFSYVSVFIHEIAHKRYNSLECDESGVNDFIKILESFPKDKMPLNENMRNAILEMQRLLAENDKKGLEELYCDFCSMVSVIDLVVKKCGDTFSLDECVKLTMESLMLPIIFQVLLVQNQLFWEHKYYQFFSMDMKAEKTFKKIKKLFTETMSRTSFICLIAQVYLVDQYSVSADAVNLIKVSEFDDISKYLLDSRHSFEILQRTKDNEKKYSMYEARELRDKILRW